MGLCAQRCVRVRHPRRSCLICIALTDWQLYLSLLMYWGIVCPLYGISLFLPSIIKELGYASTTAQLLTVPIYITAAILAVVVGWFSDRAAKRGASRWPYVFVPMCAILVGFIIAISGSAVGGVPGVVYAGVFIATCGIYPAFPGNVTWISNNLAGSYKRAAGMAFQIGLGNLGGKSIPKSGWSAVSVSSDVSLTLAGGLPKQLRFKC